MVNNRLFPFKEKSGNQTRDLMIMFDGEVFRAEKRCVASAGYVCVCVCMCVCIKYKYSITFVFKCTFENFCSLTQCIRKVAVRL
jgi:hypothetical protein